MMICLGISCCNVCVVFSISFYMLKPRQSNVTSLDNIKKSVQYLFAQKLIEAKMQKEVELFEPECQAGECFEMVENSTFAYGGTLDANSKKQMLIVNDSLSLSEWFKCVASDPRKWQIISCRLAPLSDYIDYDQRDYYDQVYYNYYLNAIRYEIGRLLPQKSNACGSFHRVVQQELTSLDLEMEQLVVENGTLPNYRTLFEKFNRLLSTVHLIDYNKINIEQEEEWVQWTDHKLNFFLCNCVPETRNATFEEQFDLIKNKLQNEKESLEKLEKSNHDLEFCKRLFDDVQSDGIDTNSPHIKDCKHLEIQKQICSNYFTIFFFQF